MPFPAGFTPDTQPQSAPTFPEGFSTDQSSAAPKPPKFPDGFTPDQSAEPVTPQAQKPGASPLTPATSPISLDAPGMDATSINRAVVRRKIWLTSQKYGVPVDIAWSVAEQESNYDQKRRSPKGAIGIFQLMPDTAKGLGVDPNNPDQNIDGGVRYLKQMHDKFGDWKLAVAAYNAGPGAVESHKGVPPYPETQGYVARVLHGAAQGASWLQNKGANLPVVKQVGDVARKAEDKVLNTPFQPYNVPRGYAKPAPTTVKKELDRAGQDIGNVAPIHWLTTHFGFAPGVRQVGDWMRKHPQESLDIVTLINFGMNLAQIIPLIGTTGELSAVAVKAAARAVERGLGKDAAEAAAQQAVREAEQAGAGEVARGAEEATHTPEPPVAAPGTEPHAPAPHLPVPEPFQLPLDVEGANTREAVTTVPKPGLGGTDGTLGIVAPGTQVAFQAADAVQKYLDSVRPLPIVEDLSKQLDVMDGSAKADDIRTFKLNAVAPPEVHDAALYHFDENPAEHLTPQQKAIYDKWIAPLKAESNRLRLKLDMKGIDTSQYTPRQVVGKGGFVDRMLGEDRSNRVRSSSILRKTTGSMKHRVYHSLVGPDGSRVLAAIKDGRVLRVENGQLVDFGAYHLVPRRRVLERELSGPESALDRLEQAAQTLSSVKTYGQQQVTKIEDALRSVTADMMRTDTAMSPGDMKSLQAMQRDLNKQLNVLRKPAYGDRMLQQRVRTVQKHIDNVRSRISDIVSKYDPAELGERVFRAKDGNLYRIEQATTKEIEAATPTRYYKDAFTNWLIHVNELRRIDRALSFIDQLKASPEFAKIAVNVNKGERIPNGWVIPNLPQFKGYAFDPRVAQVLNTIAKSYTGSGGTLAELGNQLVALNRFLRNSIFFNFMLHVPNVGTQWFIQRGATGLLPTTWYRGAKAMVRSINAVSHFNQDYIDALEAGGRLQSVNDRVSGILGDAIRKTSGDVKNNPEVRSTLEKIFGFPIQGAIKVLDSVYDFSGKATWWTNDVLTLQQVYERMDAKHETLQDALKQVARTIPDYSLPPSLQAGVGGDIAKKVLMFAPYHYGLLNAWWNMVRPFVTKSSMGDRLDALNKWAALGILATVVYPKVNEFIQQRTGQQGAYLRPFGMLSPAASAVRAVKGEEPVTWALESVATPSPLVNVGTRFSSTPMGQMAIQNFPMFTQLVEAHPDLFAKALGTSAVGLVRPIQLVQQVQQGKPLSQQALGQVGVTFPRDLPSGNVLRGLSNSRSPMQRIIMQEYMSGNSKAGSEDVTRWNNAVDEAWKRYEQDHKGEAVSGKAIHAEIERMKIKPPTPAEVQKAKGRQGTGTLPYATQHAPNPVVPRRGLGGIRLP